MSEFTLEAIAKEAEAQYGGTTVAGAPAGKVHFRALLKLGAKERKDFMALKDQMEAAEESGNELDSLDLIPKALRLLADDKDKFDSLVTVTDDTHMVTIFGKWAEESQPGEA